LGVVDPIALVAVLSCYDGDEVYDLDSGEHIATVPSGRIVGLADGGSVAVVIEADETGARLLRLDLRKEGASPVVLGQVRNDSPPYPQDLVSFVP
jgi:hypothetical protein